MSSFSLKLPASLHRQLAAAARRLGRSKSLLVREAIEAYLNGAARGSCLERAKHLAGCLAGPGDISFNPRHLDGMGR